MSLLDKLLKTIKETRVAKGTTVVAIDGHGGAGKSSLARSVLAAVPDSTHIEYDWFHLPRRRVTPEERFDNERLIKEVLKPFRLVVDFRKRVSY